MNGFDKLRECETIKTYLFDLHDFFLYHSWMKHSNDNFFNGQAIQSYLTKLYNHEINTEIDKKVELTSSIKSWIISIRSFFCGQYARDGTYKSTNSSNYCFCFSLNTLRYFFYKITINWNGIPSIFVKYLLALGSSSGILFFIIFVWRTLLFLQEKNHHNRNFHFSFHEYLYSKKKHIHSISRKLFKCDANISIDGMAKSNIDILRRNMELSQFYSYVNFFAVIPIDTISKYRI